jgi:hypothetical protein
MAAQGKGFMGKIPIGTTIGYAYGFTFGHLGQIIAQIWLPMLVVTAGGYFGAAPYYESFSRAAAENNPAAIGQAFTLLLLFAFVSLIFYAMIYVAVTRLALGETRPVNFIHFSLGVAEWRMCGAVLGLIFALFVIAAVVVLAAGLVAGLIGGLAKGLGVGLAKTTAVGIGGAIMLIVYAALIYIAVRLSFLVAPVTVAEERISLVRGWQLSRGNFWRMAAVLAVTLLPVALLMVGLEYAIVGGNAVTPKEAGDLAAVASRMQQMKSHLPMISGLGFVLSPFMFGLTLGASAFAYRTLVPPPENWTGQAG